MATPAEKAALTRDIKSYEEHVKELEDAYATGKRRGQVHGWYLGDKIFKLDVGRAQRELKLMKDMRSGMETGLYPVCNIERLLKFKSAI